MNNGLIVVIRVCLPDSQKSWIAKSFLIKEEVQLRYFNRKTNEITSDKQNDNDFYLVIRVLVCYRV